VITPLAQQIVDVASRPRSVSGWLISRVRTPELLSQTLRRPGRGVSCRSKVISANAISHTLHS
jgi:hypothetical protein